MLKLEKKFDRYERYSGAEPLRIRAARLATRAELVGSCDLTTVIGMLRPMSDVVAQVSVVARHKPKQSAEAKAYNRAVAKKQSLMAILASMYGNAEASDRDHIRNACKNAISGATERGFLFWTADIDNQPLLASLLTEHVPMPHLYREDGHPFAPVIKAVTCSTQWSDVSSILAGLPANEWNPLLVTECLFGATTTWEDIRAKFAQAHPRLTQDTYELIAARIRMNTSYLVQGKELAQNLALLKYAQNSRMFIKARLRENS